MRSKQLKVNDPTRIADLNLLNENLKTKNAQLEQDKKSLVTQISHYNELLSSYRQDLQTTRVALRKACKRLTCYTNCYMLIGDPILISELCGKFNYCEDCLFEYFLKKSKEENVNGD